MRHCIYFQPCTRVRNSQTLHLQHLFSGHFLLVRVRILGLVISAGKPRPSHYSKQHFDHTQCGSRATASFGTPLQTFYQPCGCVSQSGIYETDAAVTRCAGQNLAWKKPRGLKKIFWIWQHNLVFFSSPWWKKKWWFLCGNGIMTFSSLTKHWPFFALLVETTVRPRLSATLTTDHSLYLSINI